LKPLRHLVQRERRLLHQEQGHDAPGDPGEAVFFRGESHAFDEPFSDVSSGHGDVTQDVVGQQGKVTGVRVARAVPPEFVPIAGSERVLPAELVLIAIGFERPERDAFMTHVDVEEDARGNVLAKDYATSKPGVFACGDARRGASLVVWAINEGRECAKAVCREIG
jgi:NADPH-dependent glutamate synthase beta subunit-like oxidoreductase